jgi:hypothetical protein
MHANKNNSKISKMKIMPVTRKNSENRKVFGHRDFGHFKNVHFQIPRTFGNEKNVEKWFVSIML